MNALEYAAVHGLRTSKEKAELIGTLSQKYNITMSLHAAYYINLASKKEETRTKSRERLVKALRFAPLMKVKRVVFHPGTYGGLSDDDVHRVMSQALRDVWETVDYDADGAYLAPEIAGKVRSYGSIEQIIRLCCDVERVIPTIDWAHLYARRQGQVDDKDWYIKTIERFEDALGKEFTNNMHFHVSGITYTEAGEASHRPLGMEWGPDIFPLMEIIHDLGYRPTIISETPNPLTGALYTKFLLEELEKSRA